MAHYKLKINGRSYEAEAILDDPFVAPEHVTIEPSARYPSVTWTAGGETWQDNSARQIRW